MPVRIRVVEQVALKATVSVPAKRAANHKLTMLVVEAQEKQRVLG